MLFLAGLSGKGKSRVLWVFPPSQPQAGKEFCFCYGRGDSCAIGFTRVVQSMEFVSDVATWKSRSWNNTRFCLQNGKLSKELEDSAGAPAEPAGSFPLHHISLPILFYFTTWLGLASQPHEDARCSFQAFALSLSGLVPLTLDLCQ